MFKTVLIATSIGAASATCRDDYLSSSTSSTTRRCDAVRDFVNCVAAFGTADTATIDTLNQALRDSKGDDCVGIEASSSGRAPSFGAASLKATPDGITGNVASKRDAVFRRNELASIDTDMVEKDLEEWNAAVAEATRDQSKVTDLAGQVSGKSAEVDKYAKELDDKIAQSRKLLEDISGEFDQAKSETASMIDAHIDKAGMDVEKFESDLESAMESKLAEIRKAVADKVAKLTDNQKEMQEKLIKP